MPGTSSHLSHSRIIGSALSVLLLCSSFVFAIEISGPAKVHPTDTTTFAIKLNENEANEGLTLHATTRANGTVDTHISWLDSKHGTVEIGNLPVGTCFLSITRGTEKKPAAIKAFEVRP